MRIPRRLILSLVAAVVPASAAAQTAYVSKSGRVLFFKTPGAVRSVVAAPSVTLNGGPVALPAPTWDSGSHNMPWVAYALPAAVAPGDVLTWSAPAGWLTSGSPIPAPDGTVANYSGGLEPAFTGARTMKMGVNAYGPTAVYFSGYSIQADLAKRLSTAWSNGGLADANGWPTSIPNGYTEQLLWVSSSANGIDGQGYPAPVGAYIVKWDDSAATAPTNVTLRSDNPAVTVTLLAAMAGTADATGILRGKSNLYTVGYTPGIPANRDLRLWVRFTAPSGKNTAFNAAIAGPADQPDSTGLVPCARTLRWLRAGAPKAPAVIRYMSSTGTNVGYVAKEEIARPTDPLWGTRYASAATATAPAGSRGIGIASMGPVATSTAVYLDRPYGPTPTGGLAGLAAPAGSPAALRVPIPTGWPHQAGWNVLEVTTSAAHGLRTGHDVKINNVNYGVLVTGPSTFVTPKYGSPGALTTYAPGQVTGIQLRPDPGQVPHEVAAGLSAAAGSAHYVNVPPFADDAMVAEIACRVLTALPRTADVWVELNNEPWNWAYPGTQMGQYMGDLTGAWFILANATRAVQAHAIFADAAAKSGRPGKLVRVIGGHTLNTSFTRSALNAVKAAGGTVDAFAIAPYYDLPAFLADPARAVVAGSLPIEAYFDLARHCYLYDVAYAAYYAGHVAALASIFPAAQLVTYEGAPSSALPVGTFRATPAVGSQFTHDAVYHPGWADVEDAFHRSLQNGGIAVHTSFGLCGPRFLQANGTPSNWGMATWQGQMPGPGTGNLFSLPALGGDGKAHDYENQSVRMYAWGRWVAEAN